MFISDPEGNGPYGAPPNRRSLDEGFLEKARAWIQRLHPGACQEALASLLEKVDSRFDAAVSVLFAHFIEGHRAGIEEISAVSVAVYLVEAIERPVLEAIEARGMDLVRELLETWDDLEGMKGGASAVHLVFRSLSTEDFKAAWESLWRSELPERSPPLADAALRVLVYSPTHRDGADAFVAAESERLAAILPDRLALYLLQAPSLRKLRDGGLHAFLTQGGVEAARNLIHAADITEKMCPRLVDAVKILLDAEEDDPDTALGLILCLRIDPGFALPYVVEWVNAPGFYEVFDSHLEWRLRQGDQKSLFNALAEHALHQEIHAHGELAKHHVFLLKNSTLIRDWIEENGPTPENKRYLAGLIVEALSLSGQSADDEVLAALIASARELHARFGNRPEKKVLEAANISSIRGQEGYGRLSAIALAGDVLQRPTSLRVDEVLQRLKTDYPATYRALGGPTLDEYLEKAERFPGDWRYEDGHEETVKELRQKFGKLGDGQSPGFLDVLMYNRSVRALTSREAWERRFETIQGAVHTIKEKSLRERSSYWTEMLFLASLSPYFDIEIEPDDIPGLEDKRPEFLLRSADGDLLLEVTQKEASPEDISEAVKLSFGMELQSRIDRKWGGQFKKCEVDPGVPIVIAVRVEHAGELRHEMMNSLYGKLGFSYGPPGERVRVEGMERDQSEGFFHRSNVECISAVVGVVPPEPGRDYLEGRIYRPIRSPARPVSSNLWIRIRTALFGPEPEWLLQRMRRIPTIVDDEARSLVANGIDDWEYLAAGGYQYREDLGVDEMRFKELVVEARRLGLILANGRLEYLHSSEHIDMNPLHEAGIYTVNQLIRADRSPAGVSSDDWEALKDEAIVLGLRDVRPGADAQGT